jgi:hypothetical protein
LNVIASAAIGVPGKARGRSGLFARKDEQRSMARRVRSGLTETVNFIEVKNSCFHLKLAPV